MNSKNNPLLIEALGYAERGWAVFPTREIPSEPFLYKGKMVTRPVKSPYTKDGFRNSSFNEHKIVKWWERYPNAGIGIDCGRSGLVALDLDVRKEKDGYNSFLKLGVSTEGALQSLTPSGGLHIIYTGQTGTHADVVNGLDVRSTGAYFVAPPSWILEKDGSKGFYKKLGDWSKTPVSAPTDLEERVNKLRGFVKQDIKKNTNRKYDDNPDKLEKRLIVALEKLPSMFYDDYFKWVSVGMALKDGLGERGFYLWDSWSQKSSKYDNSTMRDKWETFKASNITVASIFYNAKAYKDVR